LTQSYSGGKIKGIVLAVDKQRSNGRVARETEESRTSVILGLAFTAGLGFVLMAISLGVGVIQGNAADSGSIGLLFAAGVALFIIGLVGWFAVAQPQKHFDDINVPLYTGHHDESHQGHE
jgi:hypothetical protein